MTEGIVIERKTRADEAPSAVKADAPTVSEPQTAPGEL